MRYTMMAAAISRRCAAFTSTIVAMFVVALGAAATLLPHAARAQADSARPCTEIENDTARLACYDRALRPARPAPATTQPRERAPAATPAPVAETATPAPRSDELSTASSVEPRSARAPRSAAAVAAAAPPTAPVAAGAPAPSPEDEIVPIVVVEVRGTPGRNAAVLMTNSGVAWAQTDGAKLNFPDPPFNAQIRPGAMGSYFLVIENRNRAVRVRRQN